MIHMQRKTNTCKFNGCNNKAYLGYYPWKPLNCFVHRLPKMASVYKKCENVICKKRMPTFNFPNKKTGKFCENHKIKGMIDVVNRTCAYKDCPTFPFFNVPSETIGLFCKVHISGHMIDVVKRRCAEFNCISVPKWNYSGASHGLYCEHHKHSGMVNVKRKNCFFEGCYNVPSYNFVSEQKGLYCHEHRLTDMVNVREKLCISEGCFNKRMFNYPSKTSGIYCFTHKRENMIDVVSKRCIYSGCFNLAEFCYFDKRIKEYCFEHKTDDMIVDKYCYVDNCNKLGLFRDGRNNKIAFCYEHKTDNMTNYGLCKCSFKNCCNVAFLCDNLYGYKHSCFEHKSDDMIKNKLFCKYDDCFNEAVYGYSTNNEKIFCDIHKVDDMDNLSAILKCSVVGCKRDYNFMVDKQKVCLSHAPNKYEIIIKRLCKFCDIESESNYVCDECKMIRHKKEFSIVREIRKNISKHFEYDSNAMFSSECTKRRPDIFYDLPKHCVIVEIDENQHVTYDDMCELSRISSMVSSIGGRSVVIIRFNPDIITNCGRTIDIKIMNRIKFLIEVINKELDANYETFFVKLVLLYYNDDNIIYQHLKEKDITNIVCI